ncbi:shikimate dehydrogenase [Helicobacter mastomyrinus]|uniref:Shikimate dehydrogenase (NADP(+)) n=1 Tax=Helicobacter mastomyrinus TaxID=287948 RepID=A0ABZ3F876_9HELI|nr:shikimate dehydrogenase [uncultured Helicobacter sp.]
MLGFFAVYGNPIAHSKSPLLHNYAFAKCDINAYYGRILLENGEELYKSFESHHLNGANITIPFKEYAFSLCDEVRGVAKDIGACNTWVHDNGAIIGYNTDAQGFYECIKDYKIKNALIIGAGGSAKAVAMILKAYQIPTTIINRSDSKLTFFADKGFECSVSSAFKPNNTYDLIINTTSAGLNDTHLPCAKSQLEALFTHASYAFDLIYGKQTPFLHLASEFKLICSDGRAMLIHQAALAFELFSASMGVECESNAIATLMGEALP